MDCGWSVEGCSRNEISIDESYMMVCASLNVNGVNETRSRGIGCVLGDIIMPLMCNDTDGAPHSVVALTP